MQILVRKILGYFFSTNVETDANDADAGQLATDAKRALWTRDYQAQPAQDGVAVTPSDSTDLTTAARALYVGGTGDVTIITPAGNTVTYSSVPVGVLPVAAKRVKATGTTATNIVAML